MSQHDAERPEPPWPGQVVSLHVRTRVEVWTAAQDSWRDVEMFGRKETADAKLFWKGKRQHGLKRVPQLLRQEEPQAKGPLRQAGSRSWRRRR